MGGSVKLAIYIIILSVIGILALYFLFTHLVQRLFAIEPTPNSKRPEDFGITDYNDLRIDTVENKKIEVWDINPQGKDAVIFAIHGWTNTASRFLPIAKILSEKYRVVLVNSRNHGESDESDYSTIVNFKDDLSAAIDSIRTDSKKFIMGHSLGGGASLLTASLRDDIDGVIVIASFADLENYMRNKFLQGRMPKLFISSMINYVEFHSQIHMKEVSPINTVKKINAPILLAYGTEDETVDYEDCHLIIEAAESKTNTELISMEGHSHSSLLDDPHLAGKIKDFIDKNV
jgi:pimeloyl-ACP methyl ester carboxylesterase